MGYHVTLDADKFEFLFNFEEFRERAMAARMDIVPKLTKIGLFCDPFIAFTMHQFSGLILR